MIKRLLCVLLAIVGCFSLVSVTACNEGGTVNVKYYADATDLMPMLKSGKLEIGLLPEPAATKITKLASDKTWYRLDLQELYDGQAKAYPQAVVMVKKSLLSACPDIVSYMQNKFSSDTEWVKNNVESAVNAVNSHLTEGVTPSLSAGNINAEVVDNCKIYWQSASDAKTQVNDYIKEITAIEPTSAKAVEDDYFYNGNGENGGEISSVKVVCPDGAPALAISKFIFDNDKLGTDKTVNYSVVSASSIGSYIINGTGDVVIIPVNASSKLYKARANEPYVMVSVITHGNLYIMSTTKLTVKDLKDKTMGVIGQGLVPDLTLRCTLSKYGIKTAVVD